MKRNSMGYSRLVFQYYCYNNKTKFIKIVLFIIIR